MVNDEKRAPRREDRPFYTRDYGNLDEQLWIAFQEESITADDSKLIREFIGELRVTSGISDIRATKLVSILVTWRRRYIPAYRKSSLGDLYQAITLLKDPPAGDFRRKQNTVRDYISLIKRFYLWMIRKGYSSIPEREVQKIKPIPCDTMTVRSGDLLSEEEVIRLIRAGSNSRDRALIAVLYEGGFRVQEVASLTWSQVAFDPNGVTIHVNMKTDRPTYKRLVAAAPYLAAWMQDYPFAIDGNAVVFLSSQKKPLQYKAVASRFRVLGKRAGIQKRVRPHIFRHSRITHLQQQGVPEAIIKKMMWGHQGTKMLASYSHLTDGDIDQVILPMHGLSAAGNTQKASFTARICEHCQTINAPGTMTCGRCGMPL